MTEITPSRRALLTGLVTAPLLARAAPAQSTGFQQPARADDAGFMSIADDMLKKAVQNGDQPFGAVIVKEGNIEVFPGSLDDVSSAPTWGPRRR